MIIANLLGLIFSVVGCINWGLIAIFDWNLVSAIFGYTRNIGSSLTYIVVLIGGLWLVVSCILSGGVIRFWPDKVKIESKNKI